MKSVPFILLFGAAAVIGISTFVEDAQGTAFIQTHVYGTWWFKLSWTAIVATSAALFARRRMWKTSIKREQAVLARSLPNAGSLSKRLPLLVLHLSFGVIFAGALTTALTGHKGILHLRKGRPAGEYVNERKQVARLPFIMRLDSFRIAYYPGTEAHADYVSQISCQHVEGDIFAQPTVSMNRIFSAQGYRFYQSSYDEDLEGSWLSVNYDPWGTGITYAGFCLMGIGFLLLLCARDGGFRRLLRHPLVRKGGLFLIALFWGWTLKAGPALPVVRRAQADSLAVRQVVYNGRIAPFNTLARDFVQKLYGRPTFHGITPEQVVSSWMLYPEEWNRVPIIRVKDRELRTALGLKEEYVPLNHLFNGTQYKLQPLWQREQGGRSKLARAIQETDEKVGLVLMLRQGTLVRPLPPGVPHLSARKVSAELWYNRIPFSKILFMVNLTLGFAAFGSFMLRMLTSRKEKAVSRRAWGTALCLATLFHAAGYALRGYIKGGFPLSNGYETMQFVALAVLLIACLLGRRFPFARPFGFLLSGFTLLVAYLGEMNPQITSLMPVLVSPWLSWHVSLIMVSYALFAFTFLNGILALFLLGKQKNNASPITREQIRQLTLLSRLLSYPATFLLGMGIVLGAVWANVSWGSYWSWDPKEAWALVAFIVYGISFHRRSLPCLGRPWIFHGYMILAFAVVLMTYFGVNYLLGGMHSYANS